MKTLLQNYNKSNSPKNDNDENPNKSFADFRKEERSKIRKTATCLMFTGVICNFLGVGSDLVSFNIDASVVKFSADSIGFGTMLVMIGAITHLCLILKGSGKSSSIDYTPPRPDGGASVEEARENGLRVPKKSKLSSKNQGSYKKRKDQWDILRPVRVPSKEFIIVDGTVGTAGLTRHILIYRDNEVLRYHVASTGYGNEARVPFVRRELSLGELEIVEYALGRTSGLVESKILFEIRLIKDINSKYGRLRPYLRCMYDVLDISVIGLHVRRHAEVLLALSLAEQEYCTFSGSGYDRAENSARYPGFLFGAEGLGSYSIRSEDLLGWWKDQRPIVGLHVRRHAEVLLALGLPLASLTDQESYVVFGKLGSGYYGRAGNREGRSIHTTTLLGQEDQECYAVFRKPVIGYDAAGNRDGRSIRTMILLGRPVVGNRVRSSSGISLEFRQTSYVVSGKRIGVSLVPVFDYPFYVLFTQRMADVMPHKPHNWLITGLYLDDHVIQVTGTTATTRKFQALRNAAMEELNCCSNEHFWKLGPGAGSIQEGLSLTKLDGYSSYLDRNESVFKSRFFVSKENRSSAKHENRTGLLRNETPPIKGGDCGGQVRGVVHVTLYVPRVGGIDSTGDKLGKSKVDKFSDEIHRSSDRLESLENLEKFSKPTGDSSVMLLDHNTATLKKSKERKQLRKLNVPSSLEAKLLEMRSNYRLN